MITLKETVWLSYCCGRIEAVVVVVPCGSIGWETKIRENKIK